VRVGSPTSLEGLADSVEAPRFATVVGLAQYASGRMAAGGPIAGGRRMQLGGAGVDRIANRVKTWLQDFF
jgi:cell division ATPase FtsA